MRQFKKYKKGCTILGILCMCLLSRTTAVAVTKEELGNPVRDVATQKIEMTCQDRTAHQTQFHHVYFGSYPQREIKDRRLQR